MQRKGIHKEEEKICQYCGKKMEGQQYVISSFYSKPMKVCKRCYAKLILDTSFLIPNS
jgi:ribosome-binding protein aMBF1 (putative translation factor)